MCSSISQTSIQKREKKRNCLKLQDNVRYVRFRELTVLGYTLIVLAAGPVLATVQAEGGRNTANSTPQKADLRNFHRHHNKLFKEDHNNTVLPKLYMCQFEKKKRKETKSKTKFPPNKNAALLSTLP